MYTVYPATMPKAFPRQEFGDLGSAKKHAAAMTCQTGSVSAITDDLTSRPRRRLTCYYEPDNGEIVWVDRKCPAEWLAA